MSQFGKAAAKRSRPTYAYSIIGVALVLLILGVLGWIFLNFRQMGNELRENVQIHAWLISSRENDIDSVKNYISSQPYVLSVEYVNKEKAKEIYNKDANESWEKILDENPLPESIDFYARASYVNRDSLTKISAEILGRFSTIVSEIQYPRDLVNNFDAKARKLGFILLIIASLLSVVVIFLIDNTIRLAMFSNRFLIKTMQMVGATRGFIARPLNSRAVINGLISAALAILAIILLISWFENIIPEMKAMRDYKLYAFLFLGMIVLGVGISWYSTNRSVMKYLKMKLDDLY